MKKLRSLLILGLVLVLSLGTLCLNAETSQSDAVAALKKAVGDGKFNGNTVGSIDVSTNSYKTSGGGFLLYMEISDQGEYLKEDKFESLTIGEKQKFLKDMMRIANAMVYENKNGTGGKGVTDETVDNMLEVLQDKSGMGSQLLATLLSETKPNYATAQRIFRPFNGPIGTCLAIIAIAIMSLLGVVMALDIAYLVIPPLQLFIDGDEGGSGGKSKYSKFVSIEAHKAKEQSENTGGGSGEYKAAVGVYLKFRWKGLVLLGICLLYLVQGQIYSLVAMIIDLFSGFIGF